MMIWLCWDSHQTCQSTVGREPGPHKSSGHRSCLNLFSCSLARNFYDTFFTRNIWWFSEDWHVAHSEVQTDCGWSWRRHPVRWASTIQIQTHSITFRHLPSLSTTLKCMGWNLRRCKGLQPLRRGCAGARSPGFTHGRPQKKEGNPACHSHTRHCLIKEMLEQVQWGYGFWCVRSCTREVLSSDIARRSIVSSNPLIISNPPSHYFHLSRRRSVKLALEGHGWLEWPSECFSRYGKNQK